MNYHPYFCISLALALSAPGLAAQQHAVAIHSERSVSRLSERMALRRESVKQFCASEDRSFKQAVKVVAAWYAYDHDMYLDETNRPIVEDSIAEFMTRICNKKREELRKLTYTLVTEDNDTIDQLLRIENKGGVAGDVPWWACMNHAIQEVFTEDEITPDILKTLLFDSSAFSELCWYGNVSGVAHVYLFTQKRGLFVEKLYEIMRESGLQCAGESEEILLHFFAGSLYLYNVSVNWNQDAETVKKRMHDAFVKSTHNIYGAVQTNDNVEPTLKKPIQAFVSLFAQHEEEICDYVRETIHPAPIESECKSADEQNK